MKKFIKWFKDLFTMECPTCNGPMYSEFFDMRFDSLVWKCKICKKQCI